MGRSPDYSDLVIKNAKKEKQKQQEEIINADIASIEHVLENGSEEELKSVHIMIDGKYSSYISNIGQSMYAYNDKFGFNYDMLGKSSLRHNLKLMKAKLQGYLYDFPVKMVNSKPQNNVSVNVPVTNTVNVLVTFEQVKQILEDMPGLSASDTEELINKIDELEFISKEKLLEKRNGKKLNLY